MSQSVSLTCPTVPASRRVASDHTAAIMNALLEIINLNFRMFKCPASVRSQLDEARVSPLIVGRSRQSTRGSFQPVSGTIPL